MSVTPESTIELTEQLRHALADLAAFPLLEALYGRRSRRFPLGGEIPDGLLAYTSRHPPLPLTELERLLTIDPGDLEVAEELRRLRAR